MINRRDFLRVGAAAAGVAALSAEESGWRTFEVTTRVEVLHPSGTTRIWAPAALTVATPFQKTLDNTFQCPGGKAKLVRANGDGLAMVVAEFPNGAHPVLTVVSRVSTRDLAVDLAASGREPEMSAKDRQHYLRATRYLPTDGIVAATAAEITKGLESDVEKARAIYAWIVENTHRDPKVRGCGLGDIRFMLESKDLGGKCADLNALFVGLTRAAGIPARDVYGIRTAKSQLGYRSLGVPSENVTKAQHCRAEVYLSGYGWVPADPADVRKVMLEEPPGGRGPDDELVRRARNRLFGSWEMNWLAYNFAHDVVLPGSKEHPLPFLMYPQAETAAGRVDSLDADAFRYEILSRQIAG